MNKENLTSHKLSEIPFNFTDGKEIIHYINQCWLILPKDIAKIPDDKLDNFAEQVSGKIKKLGDGHMIELTPQEIVEYIKDGLSIMLTNPNIDEILGFVKIYPWLDNDKPAALELGSLFVDPSIQGHHVGQLLVEELTDNISSVFPNIPLISVVTSDNTASLKLFRRMTSWEEKYPSDYNYFLINGVNILEGWGKPSSIFFHQNNYVKKND